ncbi:hypothetical protein AUP68_10285 [Ilyonectria robusta]
MASPIRFVFAGDGYGDDDDVLGVEDKGHSEDHTSELGVLKQDEDIDMNYDEEVDEDVNADANKVADEITDEEDDEYGKKDVEKDVNENGKKDIDINNIIVVKEDDDNDIIIIKPPSLDNNIKALLGYPAITPRSSTINKLQRNLLQLNPCASMQQNGTLNCSKPGMGKILEVLLTAGIIILTYMSEDYYRQNVASHRSMNVDDERCLLDHPFGIIYYCIRDSFTRDICRMTQRAPHFIISDLIRIYKKAFNYTSRLRKGGENPKLISNKDRGKERSNWLNAAGDILSKYIFYRDFGMKFLDTVIEDRRTSVKIYPLRFCNNPSLQPRRKAEMRQAIREKVKSIEKVKIKSLQFEAIYRIHEFQKILRYSVIPGLLNLNTEDWELIFFEDKDTADGAIYWNLQALKYEQLTILQRLVKSSNHGKHGIILAFSPLVMSITAT